MTTGNVADRYATMSDALISAAVHGMFRFTEAEQAEKRLEAIQAGFITSRFEPEVKQDKAIEHIQSVRLWVRGFDLSEEDEAQGFTGHYADICAAPLSGGKYTLIARKVDLPLKTHPHKRIVGRSHPNWGHPVLRILKNKQRTFKTTEEAVAVLMRLHEDFPEVTIPNPTKLYAMIYDRKSKPPVKKYVFEIKTHKEGGFYIDYRVNSFEKRKTAPAAAPKATKAKTAEKSEAAPGRFASKIELERAKKQKKSPLKKGAGVKKKQPSAD